MSKEKIIPFANEKSEISTREQEKVHTYNELRESQEKKTILRARVIGYQPLENTKEAELKCVAVLDYKGWRVLIPAKLMGFEIDGLEGKKNEEKETIYRSYISNMLYTEIEFIVLKDERSISIATKLVIADRVSAMNKRKDAYYFKSNAEGKSRVERGFEDKATFMARVVSVSRSVVFVEIFGYVGHIFKREVSWRYIDKLSDIVHVGDIVHVKFKELSIDKEEKKISAVISMKETQENVQRINMKKYTEKSIVLGSITGAKDGYYIQVGDCTNGIDVYCKKVNTTETPDIGDMVKITLYILDFETGRAFGSIEDIVRKGNAWVGAA